MIEQEVTKILLIVQVQTILLPYKCKPFTQFKKKLGDVSYKLFFYIPLSCF